MENKNEVKNTAELNTENTEVSDTDIAELNDMPEPEIKEKEDKSLLFWGYFWSYGMIGLSLILPIILGIIFYLADSFFVAGKYVVAFSFAIPLIAMGIDFIVASIFKFKHILLISQSFSRQKMTTLDDNWDNFSRKDFIFVGVFAILLGTLTFILPFCFI